MAIEVESKYLVKNFIQVKQKLEELHANYRGKQFEHNITFDRAGEILRDEGKLLRVRLLSSKQEKKPENFESAILTLKGPKTVSNGLKKREEIETEIENPKNFLKILKSVGFEENWIYEKWRESYEILGVEVDLDTLPLIGNVVELEGEEKKIIHVASLLNLENPSSLSYYDLADQYFIKHNTGVQNLLFK